jgi:integrase/recombinase XerD
MSSSSSSSSSSNQQQGQRQGQQQRQGTINNNNNNIGSEELLPELSPPELLQRKIDSATDGLTDHITTQLNRLALQQSKENALTICDYIAALTIEVNPVLLYKRTQIQVLCYLSSFYYDHHKTGKQSKLFSEMRREDVLRYLDSLRKSEASDPLHHWIGTYNLRRIHLMRFFKWLYHPDLEPKNRPIPEVVQNIPQLKRKEFSTIKPTDLWSEEDDTLFLKYCPSVRDRCYHTVSRDTSCRPSEILGLRIKDIVFKIAGDGSKQQYAMVVVNGKTGSRNLPLFNSIPYVKDWLTTHHPQKNNPNAYFIPSLDKRFRRFGNRLSSLSINKIYKNYKLLFFPALLKDPKVVPEDKEKIRDLLLKKWNPYIRRHSALTQKAQLLKTPLLKTHAGWSQRSTMNLKYEHWFGNEATESLLAEYGIIEPGSSLAKNRIISEKVRPKQCPNCSEANIPDCKFCSKCRMVLNYDAYEETLEEQKKKDKRLEDLEKSLQAQLQTQQNQQKILESIWNNMLALSEADASTSFQER